MEPNHGRCGSVAVGGLLWVGRCGLIVSQSLWVSRGGSVAGAERNTQGSALSFYIPTGVDE